MRYYKISPSEKCVSQMKMIDHLSCGSGPGLSGKSYVLITSSINPDDMLDVIKLFPTHGLPSISSIIDAFMGDRVRAIHDAWFDKRGWDLNSRYRRSVHRLMWTHISEGPPGLGCDIAHADWQRQEIHRNIIIAQPKNISFEEFKVMVEQVVSSQPSWLRNITIRPAGNSIYAGLKMLGTARNALFTGALSMPPLNSDAYLDEESYGRDALRARFLPFESDRN
jgi:hypothetical protein